MFFDDDRFLYREIGLSPEGYVYLYVEFISEELIFIAISADGESEVFLKISDVAYDIKEGLKKAGIQDFIDKSYKNLPYNSTTSDARLVSNFIIRNNSLSQLTMPSYHPLGKTPVQWRNTLKLFNRIYGLHCQGAQSLAPNEEFYHFECLEDVYYGIYYNQKHTILVQLNMWENENSMVASIKALKKWIESEHSIYFSNFIQSK